MTKATRISPHDVLEKAEKQFGMVPNLLREMSVSPAAALVYLNGQAAMENATLTDVEQQAVQYMVSFQNDCKYCMAAHAANLRTMGHSRDELGQVKAGGPFRDPRLQDLADLAHSLMERKGRLSDAELAKYEKKGITREQIIEVIALISLKTLSNYVNHISHTEIDERFRD